MLSTSLLVYHLPKICRRNTFSAELVKDVLKAFDLFDRDDRIRVVVLTAEPDAPAFCSGVSQSWTNGARAVAYMSLIFRQIFPKDGADSLHQRLTRKGNMVCCAKNACASSVF